MLSLQHSSLLSSTQPSVSQTPLSNTHVCNSHFPGGSKGKKSACNTEDQGSVPGLGRSPGEENGYPLYYICLQNPMDKGAWQATVHEVTKNQTGLSN